MCRDRTKSEPQCASRRLWRSRGARARGDGAGRGRRRRRVILHEGGRPSAARGRQSRVSDSGAVRDSRGRYRRTGRRRRGPRRGGAATRGRRTLRRRSPTLKPDGGTDPGCEGMESAAGRDRARAPPPRTEEGSRTRNGLPPPPSPTTRPRRARNRNARRGPRRRRTIGCPRSRTGRTVRCHNRRTGRLRSRSSIPGTRRSTGTRCRGEGGLPWRPPRRAPRGCHRRRCGRRPDSSADRCRRRW